MRKTPKKKGRTCCNTGNCDAVGDGPAIGKRFRRAEHVATLEIVMQRVMAHAMGKRFGRAGHVATLEIVMQRVMVLQLEKDFEERNMPVLQHWNL